MLLTFSPVGGDGRKRTLSLFHDLTFACSASDGVDMQNSFGRRVGFVTSPATRYGLFTARRISRKEKKRGRSAAYSATGVLQLTLSLLVRLSHRQ